MKKEIEQFNNMSKVNNENAIEQKIKEKKSIINKNGNNIKLFLTALAYCVGIVILWSYCGSLILFFKWSLYFFVRCPADSNHKEQLFDGFFPINEKSQSPNNINQKGGNNLSECVIKNAEISIKNNEFFDKELNFCNKMKVPHFSSKKKSISLGPFNNVINNSTNTINKGLLHFFNILPNNCSLLFFTAPLIVKLVVFLLILCPFFVFFINYCLEIKNLWNKEQFGWILIFIILFFTIFPLLGGIYTLYISVFTIFTFLLGPLIYGGRKILLELMKQNINIINIIIFINSIILVGLSSNYFNTKVYTGILIGYIPLSLMYLHNIWKLITK